MKPTVMLLLVTTVCAASAAADTAENATERPARPLVLPVAVEVAIRQNPDLSRAAIDRTMADAAALASLGIDDWILTGTGTINSNRTRIIEGQPVQQTAVDTFALALAVGRSLRSGGSFSLGVEGRVSNTEFAVIREASGGFDEFSSGALSGSVNATIRQPLLRGYGEQIARASQRKARIDQDVATLSHEITALAILRDIVAAYWEVAYALREVEIRRGSLALAEEQLRITEAGIRAGAVAPTEAKAVQQGIAVREESILLAEVNISERSLELRRLVGLEVGPGEVDIAPASPLQVEERPIDLDQLLARAIARNPQLALIELTARDAEIDVEIAQDGLRPRLDVEARGGPRGNSTDRAEAFRQIVGLDSFSVTASIEYQQAFGRRGARGLYRQARESLTRVRITAEEARREVAVSVVRAVNLVRAARKRIDVTKKSIGLAEQNLETEKARFAAGDATNFDILQRQDELEQARLSETRATVDYLNALALLDSLTGDLLQRFGVTVSEAEDS
jgi:outer membrane protein TolC